VATAESVRKSERRIRPEFGIWPGGCASGTSADKRAEATHVVARDGRTPLAFAEGHGAWLRWFA
jgi:hypothetical protein